MPVTKPAFCAEAPVPMAHTHAASKAEDAATSADELRALCGISIALNRKIALHPNADEGLLRHLAQSPDKATRRGVAMNPQTPVDVLLKLAPTFAGEFFCNPVFDLLLLEDTQFLHNLPVTVFKNILRRIDCPTSLLQWAARHGGQPHQLALAARTPIDRDLLECIASGPYAKPAEIAAGRLMSGDGVLDPENRRGGL